MSVFTVTNTTVVVATGSMGIAIGLGAIGTGILISALIAKELSTSYEGQKPTLKERLKSLTGSLNIAITPLLMIFMLIVAVKVMEVLST
mgnify:CR=1 FL=1